MKNKYLSLAAGAVLAAGVTVLGSTARAEDLPQNKAYQQFSVTQGFSDSQLAVLQRAGTLNQRAVSSELIERLHPASAFHTAKAGSKLRITGDQWSLEIAGDGLAAEYHDQAVEARAHSLGKPLAEKMSASQLEQKGRAFIAAKLASQIVLGPQDALVAVRADYRTEGGKDLVTGEVSHAVVGNRIVFSRTLNGVPVVGNGSKVILTFSNDGSLESFRYDWPKYQSGASQQVVGASDILSRVQKVLSIRNGVDAPVADVALPNGKGEVYPVTLTPNTQLQALECGYYDAGSMAGHLQSVQPGCTYLAVSHDANGMRDGYAGAVPAGSHFGSDAGWLETQVLSRK